MLDWNRIIPAWLSAVWPLLLFIGASLWWNGHRRGQVETNADRERDLAARLDRLDLRLVATETSVSHLSKVVERIDSKLDRWLEPH